MKERLRWSLVGALVVLLSGTVNAGLIRLDATKVSTDPIVPDFFSIIFDDVSSDGLLQWSEIQSFTGVMFSGTLYDVVDSVPTTIVSTLSTDPAFVPSGFITATPTNWIFSQSLGLLSIDEASGPRFSYELTVLNDVPVVGPAALIGLGLAGLGFTRRLRDLKR